MTNFSGFTRSKSTSDTGSPTSNSRTESGQARRFFLGQGGSPFGANKFGHQRVVKGTFHELSPFHRDQSLPNATLSGSPGETKYRRFRGCRALRRLRKPSRLDTKKTGEPTSIGQQPRFDSPNGYPKEMRRGYPMNAEQVLPQARGALGIVIQIPQGNPANGRWRATEIDQASVHERLSAT